MVKMVVAPLIFFSILNGITSVNNINTFSRLGLKAFLMYSCTTIFASTIGILTSNIFKPGYGFNILPTEVNNNINTESTSLQELLINIIPSSPLKAMMECNTLQIVIFAFFTGFSLISIGNKGALLKKFIFSSTQLALKMINIVIQFTPYGVFSVISCIVFEYGIKILFNLGNFILVVILALFIQYILFGLMIILFTKLNPFPFYRKIFTIQTIALATSSSKASLSIAIKDMKSKLGVSRDAVLFILPLGAAINMDATAIYLSICAVFFAQINNVILSYNQYLILILTSTIGSIGAAGFPGGAMVTMSVVLQSVGLPLEGIAIILGIDKILEMLRTVINITGDCTITLIIDKMEGNLNEKKYYS